MSPWLLLVLLPVGVVAGFLNVVAGGGTLLALPTLVFLGLPVATANGTNRVALVGQSITAVLAFRRKGFFDLRTGLTLAVPAVVGAVGGAQLAVWIPADVFKKLFSLVAVGVALAIVLRRGKKGAVGPAPAAETLRYPGLQLLLFLLVGVYGGFIQAGVGYLIMFALATVGALSLVRTNSIKVVVVGAYMLPSLLVFLANDHVSWVPGLVLTAGNSAGAWLGSHFSVKGGDRWIKVVLLLAVVAMGAKLALSG